MLYIFSIFRLYCYLCIKNVFRILISISNSDKYIHKNVLESLSKCDKTVYPITQTICVIICTLPVSLASDECSFLTLKRYNI